MTFITALPALAHAAAATWFGPATATFQYAAPGNPYDAVANDLRVVFTGPNGVKESRLAYFDQGKWKAVLVAKKAGKYRGELQRNGVSVGATAITVDVEKPIAEGFVRLGKGQSFVLDNGKRYWPLGHDLGWNSPGRMPAFPEALAEMGKNGVNWSRIWACTWDGKNPWWPNEGKTVPIGELWSPALQTWDQIVSASDKAGVRFQFVLFHHGEFTSETNSNWADNPWNVKNGGWLKTPEDYFGDPKAKQLSKNWLRYAVARYGHSPSVMAWELFNEVEWCDASKTKPAVVGAWHDEMAKYVRSIDPYHHLVVTSSDRKLPIWNQMDFVSPHGYPSSVYAMVLGADVPKDRPIFYGEVGPSDFGGGKQVQAEAVRGGIWGGLLALHAGAGQFWTWDQVFPLGLLSEYKLASQIITTSGILNEPGLKRLPIHFDAGTGGDLAVYPGAGWEPARRYRYDLPTDMNDLGKLPSYFQGTGHSEMRKEPVVFTFKAAKPGSAFVKVTEMSAGGAHLVVSVNDIVVAEKTWDAGAKLAQPDIIEVPFKAGPVTLTLDNDGPDWFYLNSVTVQGIAPIVTANAIGNDRITLARVIQNGSTPRVRAVVKGLSVRDGKVKVTVTALGSGQTAVTQGVVSKGELKGGLLVKNPDVIVVIKHQ